VHDPRAGDGPSEWFCLDGNPAPDQDWMTTTIEYHDEDGTTRLMHVPMTPADFALSETRFKKHFSKLAETDEAVPVHEYIKLDAAARAKCRPFVFSTDANKQLVRMHVDAPIIALVEERRKYWHTLQHLAGLPASQAAIAQLAVIGEWQQLYADQVAERDGALDQIARAMSELAAASNAPGSAGNVTAGLFAAPSAAVAAVKIAQAPASTSAALVTLAEADVTKCTNCKNCYQDAPELFEKTVIVVDGETREVGHLIAGAVARAKPTPDLLGRIARVAANCDAEIIH